MAYNNKPATLCNAYNELKKLLDEYRESEKSDLESCFHLDSRTKVRFTHKINGFIKPICNDDYNDVLDIFNQSIVAAINNEFVSLYEKMLDVLARKIEKVMEEENQEIQNQLDRLRDIRVAFRSRKE